MAIWRAAFKGAYDSGVTTVNTFHFVSQPSTGSPDADPHDIWDVLLPSGGFMEHYVSCCPTNWTLNEIDVVECVSPTDFNAVPRAGAHSLNIAGLIAPGSDRIPEAVCAIISLKTNVPKRWARGYVAMPCPLNSQYLSGSGRWEGGYLAALEGFAALLDDDYEVGSVEITSIIPVVYSRTQHLRGASQPWAQIDAGVARTIPKWRRSRLTSP